MHHTGRILVLVVVVSTLIGCRYKLDTFHSYFLIEVYKVMSLGGTMITRRSARNLQRLAGVEGVGAPDAICSGREPDGAVDNSPHSYTRGYTLNVDKTWKKKLEACNVDYKIRSDFKGGNFVFEFSAAMYELYRMALIAHFESRENAAAANIKVQCNDIFDKSGAKVESQIKILKSPDNDLKYTINLYHTRSKVMVNDAEADGFNAEHAEISKRILSSEDVNKLDRKFFYVISEGLGSSASSKPNSKRNQNNKNNNKNSCTAHDRLESFTKGPQVPQNKKFGCGGSGAERTCERALLKFLKIHIVLLVLGVLTVF